MSIPSLVLGASLCIAAPQSHASLDNAYDIALGTAGLTRKTAQFDQSVLPLFRSSEFETPLYSALYHDVWRTTSLLDIYRRQFSVTTGQAQQSVALAARMLGTGVRRDLVDKPIETEEKRAAADHGLLVSLERMKLRGLVKGQIPSLAGVPLEVQHAASLVLETALDNVSSRNAAFARVGVSADDFVRESKGGADPNDPESFERELQFMRTVDIALLYSAGMDVTTAVQEATSLLGGQPSSEKYHWAVDTVWGQVVLNGGSGAVYEEKPTLLVIDTGGGATFYNMPANTSPINWCSVVIATGGRNRYLSRPEDGGTPVAKNPDRAKAVGKPGPGSAFFGLSYLFDTKGGAVCRSARRAFGSSVFGLAVAEFGGDGNIFDGYSEGEGYGRFGIGLLECTGKSNRYDGFHEVQGCGGTQGLGMVVDRGGGSAFTANDEQIDFPSPQDPRHNLSMAQGMGTGTRLDFVNGKSLSGGIGILMTSTGSNKLGCGVYGQGCGYWEGLGILWGGTGDDTYTAFTLAQGAATQYAIGLLDDAGGNDTYKAPGGLAQGAGQDFSVGFLIDEAGDDHYEGGNLSQGAAAANGIGVLVDVAGSDTYAPTGISLGQVAETPKGTLRDQVMTLSLFMDLEGTDTYPEAFGYARNGTRVANYRDKQDEASQSQVGIFFDR